MRQLGKDIGATPRECEESHSAEIVHRQEGKGQPKALFGEPKGDKAS